MKSTITFTNNITVENYNALRAAVDWIQVTEKRASIALQHSFYLCVAMDGERPVGMARIVSDGGYTYFITDVIDAINRGGEVIVDESQEVTKPMTHFEK